MITPKPVSSKFDLYSEVILTFFVELEVENILENLHLIGVLFFWSHFIASGRSGVTSQTAKRILDALENMSSPLIVSISCQ